VAQVIGTTHSITDSCKRHRNTAKQTLVSQCQWHQWQPFSTKQHRLGLLAIHLIPRVSAIYPWTFPSRSFPPNPNHKSNPNSNPNPNTNPTNPNRTVLTPLLTLTLTERGRGKCLRGELSRKNSVIQYSTGADVAGGVLDYILPKTIADCFVFPHKHKCNGRHDQFGNWYAITGNLRILFVLLVYCLYATT